MMPFALGLGSAVRRVAAIVPACLVIAALTSPLLPGLAKVLLVLVLVTSLWKPEEGLLLAGGLAPLGALIAALFDFQGFRFAETVVLAFITGWLVRSWPDRTEGPAFPRWSSAAGWLFAAAVAASPLGLAWHSARHALGLTQTIAGLSDHYYAVSDSLGVTEAAKLLEGLTLSAATVAIFRRRPALAVQLPTVLVASAVVAASSSLLLWWGMGPDALLSQRGRIGVYRVSAHVPDLNAAGAYFALVLCLGLGMAARARARHRAWWLAAGTMCAVGLWLTVSRSAIAALALVVPFALVWIGTLRRRPAVRAAAFLATSVLLVAAATIRAYVVPQAGFGVAYRSQFTETSLRMIAAHPLFGIGIGRYYVDSPLFLSPELAWIYGFENAHNYFLQIASEAGVLGFALFLVWIAGPIVDAARALMREPWDARLIGALCGIAVFLVACLAGHPFLVGEVAFPFWLAFGLLAALASSARWHAEDPAITPMPQTAVAAQTPMARWIAAGVASVLVIVSVPVRGLRAPLSPPAVPQVEGFYDWETGPDGVRFRWTQQYASLFAPGDVRRIEIRARAPKEERERSEMGVEISADAVGLGRFLVTDQWSTIAIDLPPAPANGFHRVNLKMDRTWRPALAVAGSGDMRMVGVQIGDVRMVRAKQP